MREGERERERGGTSGGGKEVELKEVGPRFELKCE